MDIRARVSRDFQKPTGTIGYRRLSETRSETAITFENLITSGWDVLTIWECETKDRAALKSHLERFLESENRLQAPAHREAG